MSRYESTCPVCYQPITDIHLDVMEGYSPCEHYETCSNGCYAFEFAYGSTRVYVTIRGHHIEFGWHYTDIPGTTADISDAIHLTVEAARRALLEDLLKEHADRKTATQQS